MGLDASCKAPEEAIQMTRYDSNAAIVVQPHAPFRVPAWRGHLLRWRSSTMCTDIACVAPPCICPRQARNAAPSNTRTDS